MKSGVWTETHKNGIMQKKYNLWELIKLLELEQYKIDIDALKLTIDEMGASL